MMLDIQRSIGCPESSRQCPAASLKKSSALRRILGVKEPRLSLDVGSNHGSAPDSAALPRGSEAAAPATPAGRASLERPDDTFARSADSRRAAREVAGGAGAGPSVARASG